MHARWKATSQVVQNSGCRPNFVAEPHEKRLELTLAIVLPFRIHSQPLMNHAFTAGGNAKITLLSK